MQLDSATLQQLTPACSVYENIVIIAELCSNRNILQ